MTEQESQPHEERIKLFDLNNPKDKITYQPGKTIFLGPEKETPMGKMRLRGTRFSTDSYEPNEQGIYVLGQRVAIAPAQDLHDKGFYAIELRGRTILYSYTTNWDTRLYLPGQTDPLEADIRYLADEERTRSLKGGVRTSSWQKSNTPNALTLFARPDPQELAKLKFSFHPSPRK